MLLGVGIDILSLTRFQAVITRRSPQTLAKRICTPIELKRFQKLLPSGDKSPTSPSPDMVRFLSNRSVITTITISPDISSRPDGY
jgi:phosphopantetheinyl transferase (holo-ACP synthase)